MDPKVAEYRWPLFTIACPAQPAEQVAVSVSRLSSHTILWTGALWL